MSKPALRLVPTKKLFVSEPDPTRFGNPPNGRPVPDTWTNNNWLKSRFHFSFAEYQSDDNNNDQFGVIRVCNDDLVQPRRGFGTHPHSNMEILTYVVEGELSHKDSTGTQETIHRGSIQFMTAGTGVRHSEHNLHETKPCRFIQTWILPRSQNLPPNYGSMVVSSSSLSSPSFQSCLNSRHNKWAHLCSDVNNKTISTPVKINQDTNLYVIEADANAGNLPTLTVEQGRQAYVLCVEGSVNIKAVSTATLDNNFIDEIDMVMHDGGEVIGPVKLRLAAKEQGCHVMVFEMAYSTHYHGRADLSSSARKHEL
eukprot:c8843_g1_i1.p1 GENE.c8843_g1_i1~~c8843_g1_i1.p1  ORF type:complete len:311 (-),score=84.39 c8843_g1_i1:173-1105(-)